MRIVGYTDPLTATAGEVVRVMVSCEASDYAASLVRLVHGDLNPAGPGFCATPVESDFAGRYPGRRQVIRLGSWVEVPDHPALAMVTSFTLTAWIFPTRPGVTRQAIIAKHAAHGRAVVLGLDERGCAHLDLSDGSRQARVSLSEPLAQNAWVFLSCGYDDGRGRAWLRANPERWPAAAQAAAASLRLGSLMDNGQPLTFGARPAPGAGGMQDHFNGKIGGVCLFGESREAITPADIDAADAKAPATVGAWNFGLEVTSDRVIDAGPHRLHGRAINLPMRGTTGPRWSGRHMQFAEAPEEYDAIHFHDDDLEDAEWSVDFAWHVPETLRSGVYAIHLQTEDADDFLPVFVVPGVGRPSARAAFLAPVYSYLAYANEHYMADPQRQALFGFDIERALAGATAYERDVFSFARTTPLHSLYDAHNDGTGVCYASRRRPLVTMRPRYNKQSLWFKSPHQLNQDLCLVGWLESTGEPWDLLTDERLHHGGVAALSGYRVIMTGSHPEYWTGPMLEAMEAYLATGGRLMYLGGNGFYWVTAVDPSRPHVIEVRRHTGTRIWQAPPGEHYHSTTGEYGGPWRCRGRPPQRMVGVGFTAQGNDRSAAYRRLPDSYDTRAGFIFGGVTAETFGDYGLQLGGAAGYEMDRADLELGTPPHALRLAASFGHSDSYQHAVEEVFETDGQQGGTVHPAVRADMVFFEGPRGGAVFSVGSISWCAALPINHYDNDVARITKNVLDRFSSDQPFTAPAAAPSSEAHRCTTSATMSPQETRL